MFETKILTYCSFKISAFLCMFYVCMMTKCQFENTTTVVTNHLPSFIKIIKMAIETFFVDR